MEKPIKMRKNNQEILWNIGFSIRWEGRYGKKTFLQIKEILWKKEKSGHVIQWTFWEIMYVTLTFFPNPALPNIFSKLLPNSSLQLETYNLHIRKSWCPKSMKTRMLISSRYVYLIFNTISSILILECWNHKPKKHVCRRQTVGRRWIWCSL